MSSLATLAAIDAALDRLQQPLAYFNTTVHNLIGAERWLPGLEFVNTIDSFGGQHPQVFVPPGAAALPLGSIESANRHLVDHPAVQARLQARGAGLALLMMFDEATEAAIQRLGWRVALPPARLRQHLDSKITTTEIGNRAGIASVPNVLAAVHSYALLREVAAGLGPDLVVQLPYGDSGTTTFFISSESDFARHADAIAAQPAVKVMRRIRCQQATIEGCVTRRGTLVGPLLTELVGVPELTPLPGGWCGNERVTGRPGPFSADVIGQALAGVQAIGQELAALGYWGVFGLDYLIDLDSGELYLGEMNPRITGVSPLTSQAAMDAGLPPLLQLHLLEALGADVPVDIEAYNRHWRQPGEGSGWSQLIVEHLGPQPARVQSVLQAGEWRFDEGQGALTFQRPIVSPQDLAPEGTVFVLPTVQVGHRVSPGYSLVRVLTRGRVLAEDGTLAPRTRSLLHALRTRVVLEAMGG